MPDQPDFDAYYKWLSIPPSEQPPNFYRLLGVVLYESDPDVVEAAADQRMAHIRTYQTGRHGAMSQKILNELADARLTLLNPAKKVDYDARLRSQASSPAAEAPRVISVAAPVVASSIIAPAVRRSAPRRKRRSVPVIGIGAACLVAIGTVFVLVSSHETTDRKTEALSSPRKVQEPKVPTLTPAPGSVRSPPPMVAASSDHAADETPLHIVDRKTETYQQDGSDVARGDTGSFFVSTRGEVGAAAIGYELEGAGQLNVHAKVVGALRRYADNSFAGFIVDYHTPSGYSKRVALSLGLHSDRRTSGGPAWGKQAIPTQFVDLSTLPPDDWKLERWAPAEWDGRVWFSAILQNSGRDTSIEGRLLLPPTDDDR